MKITSQNSNMVNQSYGKNQAVAPPSADKNQTEVSRNVDSVSLSSTTRDLQKIQQAMTVEPQERSERVATLKAAVESGQYTVDTEKVAERMTGFFIDKIA
ncbi:FlgM [Desulforapulum autotrophicum HRM2]|uniref:Negative regulator of flagellin synthesis n=1 Tax=Desulforapulum autotrophicum (strain ATCC 43914 / DSM 3382 / VKM B-1955 / HRM2) TaxID=177437 RepID=C0Q9D1_DESAH|nr:flagellar biosynthesis anti-sigma factor FlgM [Desulforapulum autotrophicum]ACN16636.1 FlgM [Desulforapulum autotrophicum HRM2]